MKYVETVREYRKRSGRRRAIIAITFFTSLNAAFDSLVAQEAPRRQVDLLLLRGRVLDGAGNPWVIRDIGITGDRIAFVGNARDRGTLGRDTLDVTGLLVTPGFWDMHSHAELEKPHGKTALPFLYQGITTVILGVDGGGSNEIDEVFAVYRRHGIAVNTLHYVGHNAARRAVMGMANRAPTPAELDAMRTYVRKGMEQGALGLSSGLFYSPGSYSTTDEVVELNKVTAPYGGIYDTHDRDLGAAYKGIGYDASVKEAIEIAERAGTPLIFSHFNPQGRRNYGRAPAGAKLIEEARVRGVDVMAAQHVYTATQSSLRAYAVPRWAAAGGRDAMLARFNDRETVARLDVETMEMLDLRGGAEKILFADQRPALNGKTLAQVAEDWNLPVPETVRRIMTEANASVMNLDLYDIDNTRYLAQKEWMMTCTDGRTPPADRQGIVHPRPYGAFSRKLRLFVHEDSIISLQYAVRGMTSLGANFLGIPDRGLIKEGFFADIAVFDEARIRDRATFDDPHQYSEGTVHVLVNGTLAFRDGKPTDALAGRPIKRGGR
jgi:N-acyl-D-amino-acid deacylase